MYALFNFTKKKRDKNENTKSSSCVKWNLANIRAYHTSGSERSSPDLLLWNHNSHIEQYFSWLNRRIKKTIRTKLQIDKAHITGTPTYRSHSHHNEIVASQSAIEQILYRSSQYLNIPKLMEKVMNRKLVELHYHHKTCKYCKSIPPFWRHNSNKPEQPRKKNSH